MNCNACHRTASFEAKFSFCQKKAKVPGTAKLSVSWETEGGYCVECKGRIERMLKDNNFTEVIGSDVRNEVNTIFQLRGWGEPDWDKTVVEFKTLRAPDDNLSLPLDKYETV